MKSLILILSTLVSIHASAGPEDQTCFYNHVNTSLKNVPQRICLAGGSLNLSNKSIEFYSYFDSEVLSNMTLRSLTQTDNIQYNFNSSKVLFQNLNTGCNAGELIELIINGQADTTGTIDTGTLEVQVQRTAYVDTCHSRGEIETIKYQ